MTPAESHIAGKSPEWEQVVVCRWWGAHRSRARVSGLVLLWLDHSCTLVILCFPFRNISLPRSLRVTFDGGSEAKCKGCWAWGQQTEHLATPVVEAVVWTHTKCVHFLHTSQRPVSNALEVCVWVYTARSNERDRSGFRVGEVEKRGTETRRESRRSVKRFSLPLHLCLGSVSSPRQEPLYHFLSQHPSWHQSGFLGEQRFVKKKNILSSTR